MSIPMSVLQRVDAASAELHRCGAHQPEDRTGCPHRQGIRLDHERAEGAEQQRREVQRGEAHGTELGLEHLPEDPQEVQVEPDVDEARVQEAARDQPPELTVGDRGAEQRAVAVERRAASAGARRRTARWPGRLRRRRS